MSFVFRSSSFLVMSLISLFIRLQKSSIEFVKLRIFVSVSSSLVESFSSFCFKQVYLSGVDLVFIFRRIRVFLATKVRVNVDSRFELDPDVFSRHVGVIELHRFRESSFLGK